MTDTAKQSSGSHSNSDRIWPNSVNEEETSGVPSTVGEKFRTKGECAAAILRRFRLWIAIKPLFWALPIQAALSFWRLDLLEPWGDELHTLDTAPQSLHQIGSILSQQIHPPLYFYLLHFWIQGPWPGSLLTKMRAMSAVWALVATVVFYVLWLRKEDSRTQRTFLLLWTLSPCFLLYARMARSYTMQVTLALLAIYAAMHW